MKFALPLLMMTLFSSTIFAQSDLHQKIQDQIQALQSGEETLMPADAKLVDIESEDKKLTLLLSVSQNWLETTFDDQIYEEWIEHFASTISDFGYDELFLKAKNSTGKFVPMSDFLESFPMTFAAIEDNSDNAPAKEGVQTRRSVLLEGEAQPAGQLTGSTIWLSAGHGWQYDKRRKTFKTQRHNSHGMVEDFATIESVNYHLLKYLYNAGANVWTVRERDMNPNELIVDNDRGAPLYKEFGAWTTSPTKGYQNKSYRYTISKGRTTAKAHFKAAVPKSGKYWVSVRYVSGENRTIDARYRVFHAGGESVVCINQEVHGSTWVYLGQFYFEKGGKGEVVLTNESSELGQAVIADAVRFGGGKGNTPDCFYGKSSGEPRYEEAAKYYAAFQGFPHCMNDVIARPRYAEWELAKGTKQERRNAIYLSWHSNASMTSGTSGTESYIHSRNPVKGSWSLRQAIHNELISDLRKGWDSNWEDRGKKAADFGELRGLRTMPGVLLEMAFHDNPKDAKALTSPAFRQLTARSVYKGIVKYFAKKNRKTPVFLPEPPTHLTAENKSNGTIRLSWKAPVFGGIYGDRATEYRVYQSDNGKGFGNGIYCSGTSVNFEKMEAGRTYYFQITALNDGGESLASPVIAVRTPSRQGEELYLIVDGFDRLDRSMAIIESEHKPHYAPIGKNRRLYLERMNNFDYAVEHAEALSYCGVAFDGATNEAVKAGRVKLKHYSGVDWFLGRESVEDKTLDRTEQKLLSHYLDDGGRLIISGSELAYDLDHKKNGSTFFRKYLKATYVGDNAKSSSFAATKRGLFKGIKGIFGPSNYNAYPVTSPDYIRSINGSENELLYKNGKTAAVAYRGEYGLVHFAFPLEMVGQKKVRNALFKKSLDYLHRNQMIKSEESVFITELPSDFQSALDLDLRSIPEGRATFRLFDQSGNEVYEEAWSHRGFREKRLSMVGLPAAKYGYELELAGRKQRGFVRKR